MSQGLKLGWLCALLMATAQAEEKSASDADFFEYLGGVGGEEEGWTDYLAVTELEAAAANKQKAAKAKSDPAKADKDNASAKTDQTSGTAKSAEKTGTETGSGK
jgi:hypothetical protein